MRPTLIRLLVAGMAVQPGLGAFEHTQTAPLVLELRIFERQTEVTERTRITLHRAGERDVPIAQMAGSQGRLEVQVPEGIYDVQAIEERDGEVVNIRWANRLVVMAYPDEKGRHLEVVNFSPGFGALQVRTGDGRLPQVALYPSGRRQKPAAEPVRGEGYTLFIVPAGSYDLQVTTDTRTALQTDIEVPLDRTRLWLLQ